MTDAATSETSAAERQTREQATELERILPLVNTLAEQVFEIYQCRRIDEIADPLFEAVVHLEQAWKRLVIVQDVCATTEDF